MLNCQRRSRSRRPRRVAVACVQIFLCAIALSAAIASGATLQESAGQLATVIFKLRNRSAEDVLPLLKQQVARYQGAISGTGPRLVVTASPDVVAVVKGVLEDLDVPARRLLITVEREPRGGWHWQQDSSDSSLQPPELDAGSFTHSYHTGRNDRPASPQDETSRPESLHTRARRDTQDVQHVSVLEGQWALVVFARAAPAVDVPVEVGVGNGLSVFLADPPAPTANKLLVRATLLRDNLVLNVAYSDTSPSTSGGGQIDTRALRTTVAGHLGEWLLLSPAAYATSADPRVDLQLRTRPRSSGPRALRLRVDQIAD